MQLVSSDFSDGAKIPRVSTCEDEDASPALQWSDAPPETQSFALICKDPTRRRAFGAIGPPTTFRRPSLSVAVCSSRRKWSC